MQNNIANLCQKKIEVSKIKNPRLVHIIESYKAHDGFMFFGKGSGHTDKIDRSNHQDYINEEIAHTRFDHDFPEYTQHIDEGAVHIDEYEPYDDHSDHDDHVDHVDRPYSEYSEYSESQYHTDSNSPNYRR